MPAASPMENKLTFGGVVRSSHAYGADYLSEFQRILLHHVKPGTRAYLEWGAGHTTLAILDMTDQLAIDDLFSIDDSQPFLDQLLPQLPKWSGFHPVCVDLKGPMLGDRDPELNYSTWPLGLKRKFDFIFIDGRRRMECALMATLLCHAETIVTLHDYRRARYQPVKALYDIVEDGNQFRVMQLRKDLYPSGTPTIFPTGWSRPT
ncbi:MAG: hypothetical protein E5V49_04420 [Mesorhizobium sp.]|nr:hypothetical protein EN848_05380 [bacterium M00.F.Ca.ET.205.01.1.1]TGU53518.1 hypothetical protein EN795_09795 [bacterium M00.F.Ca.ET.152.01.1.1]TGV37025.1 hypothetical protein EN829_009820 [Mesorhizobium sp. M00.F.Ca.ET.186.01.1.1]TGZ41554.1 hypothetical protein EN805_18630 [bacterium M00.F.Ca.ET.162.01.1.1]TIW62784.1 MAG: hypothetical protein E5V48_03535 [Mesorhizobium sp.]